MKHSVKARKIPSNKDAQNTRNMPAEPMVASPKEEIWNLIRGLKIPHGNRDIVAKLVESGPSIIPELIIALNDKNEFIRGGVIIALGRIAEEYPEDVRISKSISAITENFGHGSAFVRVNAVNTIVKIGIQATPELVISSEDKNPIKRRNSIDALGKIGKNNTNNKETLNKIIKTLIKALEDKDDFVRIYARLGLVRIGVRAIDELLKYLHNGKGYRYAADVLIEIARTNNDPKVRTRIASALEEYNIKLSFY